MSQKKYIFFLILCGILCQGIIETVADEIEESSDILDRQKRVVSYVPGEDKVAKLADVPYIVIIKQNRRINCAGSILSQHVVITIAECVRFAATDYEVFSGSTRIDHGSIHRVTNITKHFVNHSSRSTDGIALLTVYPAFVFRVHTNFLVLHSGPLFSGTTGIISGYGYNCGKADPGTSISRNLRSIVVKVMDHRDCVNRYRPHNIEIFEEDVCTFDPHRHCGHTDGGAPLVVDGFLAGVRLWAGPNKTQNDPEYPDVFALLQHSQFYQWIMTNMRNIESQF